MKLFERLRNRNAPKAGEKPRGIGGKKRLTNEQANKIGDELSVELQEWMASKLATHPGFEDVRADDRIIMSAHIYAAAIVAMAKNFARLENRAQAEDDYINGTIKSIHDAVEENRETYNVSHGIGEGGVRVEGEVLKKQQQDYPLPKRPKGDGKVIDLATAKPWGSA